jgi:hypothetical protein
MEDGPLLALTQAADVTEDATAPADPAEQAVAIGQTEAAPDAGTDQAQPSSTHDTTEHDDGHAQSQ